MEIHLGSSPIRVLVLVSAVLISLSASRSEAQISSETGANMMPIAVSGFNDDLVVESNAVGPPFTNYASELDSGEGLAYYQTGLWQYAWGLPPSGTFVSVMGDRTIFQFQPYTTNNALVLNADTGLTNGTLYLVTPASYARIAILANSGDASNDTGSLTLNFSDGSSNVTTYFAPDWETGDENVAWFGPGRINLTTGADTTGPEEPSFYQTTVNIAALTGGTNKTLTSITFGKIIANSTAIYAVSGLLAGDAPPPSFPVAATGWNRDLVIPNTASGPPYTNYALEFNPNEGTAYYQAGLPNTTYGLPTNGTFASLVDGSIFKLQPYTGNNALVMSSETGISQGGLTLKDAQVYDSISVIANSAAGGGTPNVTFLFFDGSTLVTNFNAQDWFGSSLNVALAGFDRINLTTGATDGGPTSPRIYQTTYDLTALFGPTNKPVVAMVFDMAAGAGATAIYGLSGVPYDQSQAHYSLPFITNRPATQVTTVSATINGRVVFTGGAAPEVLIYYGPTEGGTTAANWSNHVYLGFQSGSFTQNLTGLSPNTTYYYREVAINPAGPYWATTGPPSPFFTTLAPALASLTNLPAANIGTTAAIFSGNVLSTGGDAPVVTLFYGPSNGGNTPGAWANSIALAGTQQGFFGQAISGLAPNTTYYFTAEGSNAAGASWGEPVQSFTTSSASLPSQNFVSVLTGRNDNGRTGQNTNETTLTLANVNTNSFGLLYAHSVDGYVMAQPLVLANVALPGAGFHNVLVVATEHDSVYAFDSDLNGPPLWHDSFIDPANGITSVNSYTDLQASSSPGFYGPEVGISGTPAIDPATGTIYVEVQTREVADGVTNFVHRLHALDVVTGAEKFGGPVVIQGGVPGVGDGFNPINGVEFDSSKHMNRPALLLANGQVCVMFTSHQDFPPYHGWVFTYNAYTLEQEGVFNTTPNGSAGGIWQAGSGPAADAAGNIYVETGNGTFDAANENYGDSVIKLAPVAGLPLLDYFTPYNQLYLNLEDLDIGSAGLMLLPDSVGSSAHPHLLVAGSKMGVFWLLDRDNLGQFNAGGDTQIVQEISGATGSMWVTPAYFNGTIYYSAAGDHAKAFAISNGVISTSPISQSTATTGYPGSSLVVSANGVNNAIVWGINSSANQSGPAILNAYNATNLNQLLYSSSQIPERDSAGYAIKYTMPTVANGKVYVGGVDALSVYGNSSFLPVPIIAPDGGVFTNSVSVTLSSPSNGVSFYFTLDGSTPTTNSTLYTGPFAITNSVLVQAIAALAGQIPSQVSQASFTSSAQLTPYEAAVLGDGPLAYWPLNETAGLVAADLVGGNPGTYNGNVTLAQPGVPLPAFGSSSYSVLFDGSSAYVNIPEGPFNISGAITALLWVNIPSTPAHFSGLMGHGDPSWRTSINPSGELGAADGSNPDATCSFSIAGTGWHMVAYTYNGNSGVANNGALYVDGAQQASNTVATAAGDNLDVWIGGSPDYGTGRLVYGNIAHAAVFAKALAASQIASLYQAASVVPNVSLNLAPAGAGQLNLTWSQGILLQSTNLAGPWATNTANSPYTIVPSNSQMYFKVLVN
jgi:hypothetical protein